LNNINRNFYTIIQENGKPKRLYYEELLNPGQMLSTELYYIFVNSFKNNYRVFYVSCQPNHKIKFSVTDLNFLKSEMNLHKYDKIIEHYVFSEEVLKIKKMQYLDLTQIYNIAVQKNTIGAFFIHPFLLDEYYCFNIFLIVTNEFNFKEFLNLNFNTIKINSCVEYYENTLTLEFLEKIYDLNSLEFKDYIIPSNHLKKTRPYDRFALEEKKEYDDFLDYFMKCESEGLNVDFDKMDLEATRLKNKWFDKEAELRDMELYKKLIFQKLCLHFYIFHKIIVSDTAIYTNFLQLTGGGVICKERKTIDYNALMHYCIQDLIGYSDERLFSIFYEIYQ
jgi:hypothetical protein